MLESASPRSSASGMPRRPRIPLRWVIAALVVAALTAMAASMPPTPAQDAHAAGGAPWAFEETFDFDPPSPSQNLLPQSMDYVVTHRTHPADHFPDFDPYPADHDENCAGPDPAVAPLPQHQVATSHRSTGLNPDASFFICKNHMMSSMGEVDGYSVTSFFPKQEFDFSDGGVLEFDVNINEWHPRSWWEVLITPREQLKVGAADSDFPIDETYPADRIVLSYEGSRRRLEVGTGAFDPDGVVFQDDFWATFADLYPTDPAIEDRRIRRTMRITLAETSITWEIEKEDGTFDAHTFDLGTSLPFDRGLVIFKTHAYTPKKDSNFDVYTFHWDNIRFDGPVVGRYATYEATEPIYLEANGHRTIGDSGTNTIYLPDVGDNPVLFGQVHSPIVGQVLVSINGGPDQAINPPDYDDGCAADGWKSFRLPLDPTALQTGTNTFTWTVGPRPGCVADWVWDGFSIKSLEIQVDSDTFQGSSGRFVDDDGSVFEIDIEALAAAGITLGCNPPTNDRFCPDASVTRGQIAAFLDRALDLPSGPDRFIDDNGSPFETHINAIAEAGITLGCDSSGTVFCVNELVTRGQMAAFLDRALDLPSGPDRFIDDNGSPFETHINAIAEAGITLGCDSSGSVFCPGDDVTRGQMAAFLNRALARGGG